MADTDEKVYIAKEGTSQEILNRVGSSTDAGNATVMGKLNALSSKSVIKSIQRGSIKWLSSNDVTVSIAKVDVNKTFVYLNGACFGAGPNSNQLVQTRFVSITENSLTVNIPWGGIVVDYEIIEFY